MLYRRSVVVDLSSKRAILLEVMGSQPHRLTVQHARLVRGSQALVKPVKESVKRYVTAERITLGASGGRPTLDRNVVQRLRDRIAEVQSAGIMVRTEWLGEERAAWCELRGVCTILLDASQPAEEQLGQLEDILCDISRSPGFPLARVSSSRAA